MQPKLLNQQELELIKSDLPEWKISQNKIKRELKFQNFIDAFGFMTKVAIIAEGINHHPNWSNVYALVKIELTTHDLGGLSNLDIHLASEIDKLFSGS